jgi:hypothetical protein
MQKSIEESNWITSELYSGYEFNRNGSIRSIDRISIRSNRRPIRRHGKVLKSQKGGWGYLTNTLNGKQECTHRILAKVFIPNPDNKPQVNHKNGIKTDNRVENLEWVTKSENRIHALRTGLIPSSKGELNANSRLLEYEVAEIRTLRTEGVDCKEIAFLYSISRNMVYKITNYNNWN